MAYHQDCPEIWLKPTPNIPKTVLLTLIESGDITATPRLGVRGPDHEKGYAPGQVVTLRVRDATDIDLLVCKIRVDGEDGCGKSGMVIKPLNKLAPTDLKRTFVYKCWREIREDLSFFEGRHICKNEKVSIVLFSYL